MALSVRAWTVFTLVVVVVVVVTLTFAPNFCLVSLIVIGKIALQFDKKGRTTENEQGGVGGSGGGGSGFFGIGGIGIGGNNSSDSIHGVAPPLPITQQHAAVQGSSSTSSSWSWFRCKYDVYLNFRGTDIPKGFVDHLHRALADAGVSVFKGVDELGPGEDILPQVEAIKGSKTSIAILSADYASSEWCLNELVQMWECREANGQTIIPIFYGISPRDVKNQAGDFGLAFSLHKTVGVNSETIETWRKVLRDIGELSGYSAKLYNGFEDQLAREVAVRVARMLRDYGLVVTDKPVGIDHHVQEIMRKLGVAYSGGQATEVRGKDVCVVGIYGVPGVGKTTLAKVVFNQMRHLFDACSFLPGISSKQVKFSRSMLIADLQVQNHAPVESSGEGTEEIASLCRNARVLIVLDDVDEDKQIEALAGKLTWFGPGSRIIVTTTKLEVKSAFDVPEADHETVEKHEVELMSSEHALQLFCNRAFQGAAVQDVSEYFALSRNIVEAIGGIPGDIVRHASYLRDNMDMHKWKSTLESLQKHPKDSTKDDQVSSPIQDSSINQNPSVEGRRLPVRPSPGVAPAPAGKKRIEPEPSSASSSSPGIECDVFLSFKRTDTREIKDKLYSTLTNAGISFFKNDNEHHFDEELWPQVIQAIKRSRISIAILSADYASSKSCLMELAQMWECRMSNGQNIIPIFYRVSPSDVKHLAGDFGKAFSLHKTAGVDSETIETWRQVLRQIGRLSGYVADQHEGYEDQLAKGVVVQVARTLRDDDLAVTDKLVGIDHHVQVIMRKLGVANIKGRAIEVGNEDVHIVGIRGVPGVGKTTLAKVVFNQMRNLFEASSFLEGISSKEVRYLQRMLIADLKKPGRVELRNSDEGIKIISSLFRNRKVLIVLDDVDEDEQINALAKKLTWFGPGSRILVTTNKIDVLSAFDVGADDHGTVEEYVVEPMNYDHALQLFCYHASKMAAVQDLPEYFDLSRNIVEAIGRIPSDIVHHASFLGDNMDIDIWKNTLESLQKQPKDSTEDDQVSSPIQDSSINQNPSARGRRLPVPPSPGGARAPAGKKRRKPELSSSSEIECDVFLSFKGTNTREIKDQLYRTLADARIPVFKYDNEHHFDEELPPQVKDAIKRSRISIAILSADYASSKSCLMELAQMWECRMLNGQNIIPIFCGISPSDVTDQAGDFEKALGVHKTAGVDSETIETWRTVLREIGGLHGYVADLHKGFEDQLAREVAVRVALMLRDYGLVVTDKPIGIDHHVQEIMRKLGVAYSGGQATEVRGKDVCVVGIYGVPGVGKTTLAKVVFHQVRHLFDACSFLPGISSKQVKFSRGMLIADLQIQNHAPVESSGEGTEEIASLCRNARVLIVLDDVDADEQIKALAGTLTWFGPGSRIIVTTTTQEVLSAFGVPESDHETVEKHKVELMSPECALQLFRNHAFQGDAPEDGSEYDSLSRDFVKTIQPLPSRIVTLASSLLDENIHVWRSNLDLLQKALKALKDLKDRQTAGGGGGGGGRPAPLELECI